MTYLQKRDQPWTIGKSASYHFCFIWISMLWVHGHFIILILSVWGWTPEEHHLDSTSAESKSIKTWLGWRGGGTSCSFARFFRWLLNYTQQLPTTYIIGSHILDIVNQCCVGPAKQVHEQVWYLYIFPLSAFTKTKPTLMTSQGSDTVTSIFKYNVVLIWSQVYACLNTPLHYLLCPTTTF